MSSRMVAWINRQDRKVLGVPWVFWPAQALLVLWFVLVVLIYNGTI